MVIVSLDHACWLFISRLSSNRKVTSVKSMQLSMSITVISIPCVGHFIQNVNNGISIVFYIYQR